MGMQLMLPKDQTAQIDSIDQIGEIDQTDQIDETDETDQMRMAIITPDPTRDQNAIDAIDSTTQ